MEEVKKTISGQMGFGYGSKYQLLRMLGWHRNYLNHQVADSISSSDEINWLDFDFNGPEDREIINAQFLDAEIEKAWEEIWPSNKGRNGINWDAVGVVDGEYILVEAKAHLQECENSNRGGGKNPENAILKILDFQKKYGISKTDWLDGKYYQLANRLIFVDFLRAKGIPVQLVYILFLNGYEFNIPNEKIKSVKKPMEWEMKFDGILKGMGIKGTEAEKLIHYCYIDCNSKHPHN